jgi:hypothetical protein
MVALPRRDCYGARDGDPSPRVLAHVISECWENKPVVLRDVMEEPLFTDTALTSWRRRIDASGFKLPKR